MKVQGFSMPFFAVISVILLVNPARGETLAEQLTRIERELKALQERVSKLETALADTATEPRAIDYKKQARDLAHSFVDALLRGFGGASYEPFALNSSPPFFFVNRVLYSNRDILSEFISYASTRKIDIENMQRQAMETQAPFEFEFPKIEEIKIYSISELEKIGTIGSDDPTTKIELRSEDLAAMVKLTGGGGVAVFFRSVDGELQYAGWLAD